MVHSLTLISQFPLPSSVHNSSSSATSAAVFGSNRRVLYTRKSLKRASIYAAAVAEAPPALERRRKPASLYDVLSVKKSASAKEIKAAYRNLAKLYHPDAVSRPSEEYSEDRNFIEIHDAYVTLSDPAAIELYDLKLSVGSYRRGFGDGFENNRSGFYPTRRWETDQCW